MRIVSFRIPVEDPTSIDSIKDALEEANGLESALVEAGIPSSALRPHLLEDSFSIDTVAYDKDDKDMVHISFSFDWDSYVGCRNINDAGTESDNFTGIFEGSILLVEVQIPEREPDTY
jgi:hypothetical protein